MMESADSYLRDFRAENSVYFFFGALGVGSTALLLDIGTPWFPVACVAVYGLFLVWLQRRYRRELTETIKDSPYFLGFSLTLVSLWVIFHQAALAEAVPSLSSLSGAIGAALGTTVAGLLLRQLLQSYGVLEEERGAILRTLSDELSQHTEEFADAQSRLLKLVDEFTDSRERLFSREEEVFQDYVQRMERGESLLEEQQSKYRESLTDLSEEVENELEDLRSTTSQLSELRDELQDVARKQNSATKEILEDSLETHRELRNRVESSLAKQERALDASLQTYNERLDALRVLPEQYESIERGIKSSTRSASEEISDLVEEVRRVRENLRDVSDEIGSVPSALESSRKELGDETERLSGHLKRNLEAVAEDVERIDAIVDEVVEVLENRMSALR